MPTLYLDGEWKAAGELDPIYLDGQIVGYSTRAKAVSVDSRFNQLIDSPIFRYRVPYGYITVKTIRTKAISPVFWFPYGRKLNG